MRVSLLLAVSVIVLLIGASSVTGQDMGDPDSAYFLNPSFAADGCTGGLKMSVPLYIWTDFEYNILGSSFSWEGGGYCDTVLFLEPWNSLADFESVFVDTVADSCEFGIVRIQGFGFPDSTGVIAELVFQVGLNDSITVSFQAEGIYFYNGFGYEWYASVVFP
ncbi:MAG: hypothetical protein ABIK83_12140 [Candidatus Zixiibacteriota bacterium]